MGRTSTRYVVWVLLGVTGLVAVTLILSVSYYGSLKFHPVSVWHGANMGARSLFTDDKLNDESVDGSPNQEVIQKLKSGRLEYANNPIGTDLSYGVDHKNLTNLRVANQSQRALLAENLNRLDQINQRLRDSERTLNAMKQVDLSSLAAATIQDAERASIKAEFANTGSLITPDVDAAFTQRSAAAGTQSIPTDVLENIENTTGISPEEINEILNQ